MSTLGPPTPPAPLSLYNTTATISTPDYGTLSSSGMPTRTLGSTDSNIPCRLDTITPGQALKYGYVVDETAFRLICPVSKADGSDLLIGKNQYITVGGVQYMTLGAGRREGVSGEQTAILKKEDR
jgi:hypothetical protein